MRTQGEEGMVMKTQGEEGMAMRTQEEGMTLRI